MSEVDYYDATGGDVDLDYFPSEGDPCSECGQRPHSDHPSILARLENVEAALHGFSSKITGFSEMIQPYLDQITPLIEQLASSPLFRAMTGGKKK